MTSVPMTGQSVLLVEDEPSMRSFLRDFLTGYGYALNEAESGPLALHMAAKSPPDIVLLDLRLPGMDGEEVLTKLRQWYVGPIIVLTVEDQDDLKIFALDHGANDYVTKPFSTGELLARIRAALRNADRSQLPESEPEFRSGDLKVDLASRRVYARGLEVRLTPMEYKVLTTFVRHAGKPLSNEFLLKEIWQSDKRVNLQCLRVYVVNLRRKIEANPHRPRHLLTEAGFGYRLATRTSHFRA